MATFDATIPLDEPDGTDGFLISSTVELLDVTPIGDFNGDGAGDLIMIALGRQEAYVVYGPVDGPANVNLDAMAPSDGFVISVTGLGGRGTSSSITSVAGPGNVNLDGNDDILIAVNIWDARVTSYDGFVYLVTDEPPENTTLATLGGASALESVVYEVMVDSATPLGNVASYFLQGYEDDLNVKSLQGFIVGFEDGAVAYDFDSNENEIKSGMAITSFGPDYRNWGFPLRVSVAGDINDDGYDDYIIGAPFANQPGGAGGGTVHETGKVYVFFGAEGGPGGGGIADFSLDGSNGFMITGLAQYDLLGHSVSGVGDVNADGIDDFIVGAPFVKVDGHYSGEAYVIFGKQSGFAPNLDLSTLDGSNGFRIHHTQIDQWYLPLVGGHVSAAGDVNGDGIDDILVSGGIVSPYDKGSIASYGVASVIFGKRDGFSANLDLATLDAKDGFAMMQGLTTGFYGVSAGGDINGDGADDLIALGRFKTLVIYGKPQTPTEGDDFLKGGDRPSTISGLGGNDNIHGHGGNDILSGNAGLDIVFGGSGNDQLFGGSGVDWLQAGPGVDQLYGGSGNDSLISEILGNTDQASTFAGGSGNDEYDLGYSFLVVIVENPGEGTDTVFSRQDFVLPAEVENLNLMYDPALLVGAERGTGNGLANTITGTDEGYETGGANTLMGMGGNDTLHGLRGNDRLEGGTGNDRLNGGEGADVLIGGAGDDTYLIDRDDTVTELANGGTDKLLSDITITLGNHVEYLTLTGSKEIDGTGNTLSNRLTGNLAANSLKGLGGVDVLSGGAGDDVLSGGLGNDSLNGGAGKDRLTGGAGADSFIFDQTPGAAHRDTITDYNVADDTIRIENADFRGLATGALNAGAFVGNAGGNAADASDRIIYETDTGKLYFDRDGTGSAAKVHFATLDRGLALTAADFVVF